MGSRRRNRNRRPARRPAHREAKRRLLVVTEGRCTEPDYIKGYERHVRNATVEVEVAKERGDPRKVVEIAKEEKARAAREAKRQDDPFLDYDEVWCVFDRDEHDRFDEALTMARDNGFELAVSNPCVELWLLLHVRDSPGARHRHVVQKMLGDYLPGYEKKLDFDQLAHSVADGTARARRLDEAAESRGDAKYGNPSTGFYRLTDSIAQKDDDA